MRHHATWSAVLLLGALAAAPPAQAQAPDEADNAPPEQALPADPGELRRLLLTTPDPALRRRAAWEGWKVPFGEDVWLELLGRSFPNIEEEEEARYLAAYALARVGTERCLPKVLELLRTPPQCLSPHGSSTRRVARYPYLFEAGIAYERLAAGSAIRTLEARLAPLGPVEQADALAKVLCDPQGSYAAYRTDVMPRQMPAWWLDLVGRRLGDRGPRGAAAIARALETVGGTEPGATSRAYQELLGSPDKNAVAVAVKGTTPRERLCNCLVREFLTRPETAAREARPPAPPPGDGRDRARERRLAALGGGDERLRALRAAMDPSPELRQALIRAVRAVAGRAPWSEREAQAFTLVEAYALVELEPDLMAFIRDERSNARGVRLEAVRALASLGTDSAIEFIVQWEGTCVDGDPSTGYCSARFAARYLAELEREAATPWTSRFLRLSGGVTPSARAPYVDLPRLERVVVVVRESLTTLPAGQQRGSVEFKLDCLERGVANVKRVKAQLEEDRR